MKLPDFAEDRGEGRHRAKVHNERVKMRAGALNAIGIALIGAAVIFPLIREQNLAIFLELRTWVWILIGGGLHQIGVAHLGRLRRED